MIFTADNLPEAARYPGATLGYSIYPHQLNGYIARILNRLNAAHGGLLSKLLNGAAAIETASPTTLPEWAKATADDLLLMAGKTWSNEADPLNYHAARVLARMPVQTLSNDAVEHAAKTIYERAMSFDRGGVPAWQERGNSDAQERARDVARDVLARESQQPKSVDQHSDDKAVSDFAEAMKAKLAKKRAEGRSGWDDPAQCKVEHLARMLMEHLPKGDPVDVANFCMMLFYREGGADALKAAAQVIADPVRFALEKVDRSLLMAHILDAVEPVSKKEVRLRADSADRLFAKLAEILPVAEPVKSRADLTNGQLWDVFDKALKVYWEREGGLIGVMMSGVVDSLRASLSAYAPPQRKVEVTPEVMWAWLEAVRAAFDLANSQAEARESEEIARLKDEVERLGAQLDHVNAAMGMVVTERDDAQHRAKSLNEAFAEAVNDLDVLRAHADKLEAMLTVDGVDGEKVKLWLPFEHRTKGPGHDRGWKAGAICFAANTACEYRQSPAPAAAQLKRWRYPLSATSTVYVTTDAPCSINDLPEAVRDLAVEVIGEAGE